MKKLLLAAVAFLAVATSAQASDRVPLQFVGSWCAAGSNAAGDVFRRDAKCNDAHEPEEILIIRPDRLDISDMATCKFLEITETKREGNFRLKFWCKSPYQTWIYDAWFAAPGRNRIIVNLLDDNVVEEK